jgi:acetolactate synthase-1/2/3 large subunit
MHGNYGPNLKTNECDVLIALGMRFDDRVTGNVSKYAKQAKVIHLDIDAAELNKIIPADVALHADAKEALHQILPLLKTQNHKTWRDEFKQADAKEFDLVVRETITPQTPEITMGQVIHLLSEITQGEAVIVTDVGQHQMVTSRYFKYKSPRTKVTKEASGEYIAPSGRVKPVPESKVFPSLWILFQT